VAGKNQAAVHRTASTGTLDATFGTNGHALFPVGNNTNDEAQSIAVDAQQRIIVAGNTQTTVSSNQIFVARLTSTGALDPSFANGGKLILPLIGSSDSCRTVRVGADGKIVIAGTRQGAPAAGVVIRIIP
jgi:uncharacterized delta-60 repeat protein